jgi:predicted site-specific integrase-resolvase
MSAWLTPIEAAQYCKVSLATFNRWVREEGIRPDGLALRAKRYLPQTLDSLMTTMARRPRTRGAYTRRVA